MYIRDLGRSRLSDDMLRLGPRTPGLRTLLVTAELQHLVRPQLQGLLEVLPDLD